MHSIPVHSADNRRKQKVKEARVTTYIGAAYLVQPPLLPPIKRDIAGKQSG